MTRVRAGPLQGCPWTLFAGMRFVRGNYEPLKTSAILGNLEPGAVFWDVGANAGYFTLLASRTVGEAGAVIAFEPSPINLVFLRKNLTLNRCDNVTILGIAAASEPGMLRLNSQSGRGTHHIDIAGDRAIIANTVDALIYSGYPPPSLVKIDTEGFEIDVLLGMTNCLRRYSPKLIVAVHSEDLEHSARAMLMEYGFHLQARMAQPTGDVELLFCPDRGSNSLS